MKTYHVVAAIIEQDGRIFATQRGYGAYKDGWEFPGGKIEENETAEQAIVREIEEELEVAIEVRRHVVDVAWDYPDFHLEMACFLCCIKEGAPHLVEHEARSSQMADCRQARLRRLASRRRARRGCPQRPGYRLTSDVLAKLTRGLDRAPERTLQHAIISC